MEKILIDLENNTSNKVLLTDKEILEKQVQEQEWNDGAFYRAIADLREKRNNLLAETDYLALSDNTMSEAMTTYRQALRDITNGLTTIADVEAVVFPNKP
jgi:hypothetical protein